MIDRPHSLAPRTTLRGSTLPPRTRGGALEQQAIYLASAIRNAHRYRDDLSPRAATKNGDS